MNEVIYPVLTGLVGLILGLIIARFSEKSKANKILNATKKEAKALIKEAKVESEVLKEDKILQAKEKFIELKSEHEKVILSRQKKISEIEIRTRDEESQVQSQVDKTKLFRCCMNAILFAVDPHRESGRVRSTTRRRKKNTYSVQMRT